MGIRKTLKINKKKFRYSGKMRGGDNLPTSSINPVGVVTLPILNRAPFVSRGDLDQHQHDLRNQHQHQDQHQQHLVEYAHHVQHHHLKMLQLFK